MPYVGKFQSKGFRRYHGCFEPLNKARSIVFSKQCTNNVQNGYPQKTNNPQTALQSHSRAKGMVRVTGLEPVRQRHTPLKRACLPIPAHSQITQFKQHIYYITLFIICQELFNFFYHLKSFIINASDRENSGRACLREFSCTINFSSAASVTGIFSAYACY